MCWKRWVHHYNAGIAKKTCDWRNVTYQIEIEFFEERCVECVSRRNVQKRVPVGGGFDDRFDSNIAAGTGAVLNDKLLAHPL